MEPLERRNQIHAFLSSSQRAVSGSKLASMLEVRRQVIVQDIALLRAAGHDIIATPQGYLLFSKADQGYRKTIACKHDKDGIRDELTTIVDEGGTIIDVIVEHRLYGQICGNIMVSSRRDVDNFINKIEQDHVKPLSNLTDGVHLHTIEAKNEDIMAKIEQALLKKNYLLK